MTSYQENIFIEIESRKREIIQNEALLFFLEMELNKNEKISSDNKNLKEICQKFYSEYKTTPSDKHYINLEKIIKENYNFTKKKDYLLEE